MQHNYLQSSYGSYLKYDKFFPTDVVLVAVIEGTFQLIFTIAAVIYIAIVHLYDKRASLYSNIWIFNDEDVHRVAGECVGFTSFLSYWNEKK